MHGASSLIVSGRVNLLSSPSGETCICFIYIHRHDRLFVNMTIMVAEPWTFIYYAFFLSVEYTSTQSDNGLISIAYYQQFP